MAIQTLNTIKSWFKTGLKPSQNQFWDTWDSFRHKNEKVPLRDIENFEATLDTKAEKSELESHITNISAHSELFSAKEDKANKGNANGYVPLDAFSKIANQYLNIVNDLFSGGSDSPLSAEQGKILQNQIDGINTLLQSDNVTLNTLQKIADAIKEIQNSLNISLVNDLTTGGATEALTAEMGKTLNEIKLTATLATDEETQINLPVSEDNKVVSRLKLFNWWADRKNNALKEILDENPLVVMDQSDNYINLLGGVKGNRTVQMVVSNDNNRSSLDILPKIIEARGSDATENLSASISIENGSMKLSQSNDETSAKTDIIIEKPIVNSRYIFKAKEENKDYYVVSQDDSIRTSKGTKTTPPLVLPSGELTTIPANGAIERDLNGKLWTTHGGVRYMLTEDDGSYVKILLNGGQIALDTYAPYISTNSVVDTLLGTFPVGSLSNTFLARLTMIAAAGDVASGGGTIAPTLSKFQIIIKFTNALLGSHWSSGSLTELVLIDNVNITGTTVNLSGTHALWDANLGLFNGYYVFDKANTTQINLNQVSAQIVCRRRLEFADSLNVNKNNQAIRVYTSITSTLVERIRP